MTTLTFTAPNYHNLTDAQRGSDVLFPIFSSTMKNIIKAFSFDPKDKAARKVMKAMKAVEKDFPGINKENVNLFGALNDTNINRTTRDTE